MFESWITESRTKLEAYGWRRTLFGGSKRSITFFLKQEKIDEAVWPQYIQLTEHGKVVWAAIGQANSSLFLSGAHDLPANVLFGMSSYFDSHPHHLRRIATRIFELKGTFPQDYVLRKIAATITDESNYITNWRIPYRLTDGHRVYITSAVLHRSRLPNSRLTSSLIPLVVAPKITPYCMIAPLDCWPTASHQDESILETAANNAGKLAARRVAQEQLDEDERDAQENPYKPLVADDLVPGASKAVLSLTPRCAAYVRQLAREGKMGKDWHLSIGGNEEYRTMDISTKPISLTHEVIQSEGITLACPKAALNKIRGTVIDYTQTSVGTGFRFIGPY